MRVGIDLVQVARTQESLDRFGQRFLSRVFTTREVSDSFAAPAVAVHRLAARFAAKEATIKVLRPGAELRWIDFRSIEVQRQPDGSPQLVLTGDAAALAAAAQLGAFTLSMSHEGDYATAVVVALQQQGRDTPCQ